MANHTAVDSNYSAPMEEIRAAILPHITGVCNFPANLFYKACSHGPIVSERLDPGEQPKAVLTYPIHNEGVFFTLCWLVDLPHNLFSFRLEIIS